MNWNTTFAEQAAEQAFQRQVEEANRQREVLGLGKWSDAAVVAYRRVTVESSERRKANADEARMGE